MLQCTGCGQAVSEWAARCPGCRRSTEDATVLPGEDDGPGTESAPIPGADAVVAPDGEVDGEGQTEAAEPAEAAEAGESGPAPAEPAAVGGRRARPTRRWVVGVAIVAVGAAVGAAVLAGVSHSRAPTRATEARLAGIGALTGDVVSIDPQGRVLLSNPAGAVRRRPTVGPFPDRPVAVALDGRALIGDGGRVLALGPHGVTASDLTARIPAGGTTARPDPFADQDRAVVVLRRADDQGDATVSVVPLGHGTAIRLGRADSKSVAGDPRAVGVFVAVSESVQPTTPPPGGAIALVDSRVELRDAGARPVALATAAGLNRAVGQEPDTPVHLAVYPSPTGDRVAVVVEPPSGVGAAAGMVVLTRGGGMVAAIRAAAGGPVQYVTPTWSPDGRRLAYPALIRNGPEIGLLAMQDFSQLAPAVALWDLRDPANVRQAPASGVELGSCVWSPDASAIVCPAERPDGAEWILGRSTGSLVAFSDQAIPVAWLVSG